VNPAIEEAKGCLFESLLPYFIVTKAALGNDAGMIGAARLVHEVVEQDQ